MSNVPSNGPSIVARLRAAHPYSAQYANGSNLLAEAADEIERLTAALTACQTYDYRTIIDESDRLRAALMTIQAWDCLSPLPRCDLLPDLAWLREVVDRALQGETLQQHCPDPASDSRQGERGPPYCAKCGEQLTEDGHHKPDLLEPLV